MNFRAIKVANMYVTAKHNTANFNLFKLAVKFF